MSNNYTVGRKGQLLSFKLLWQLCQNPNSRETRWCMKDCITFLVLANYSLSPDFGPVCLHHPCVVEMFRIKFGRDEEMSSNSDCSVISVSIKTHIFLTFQLWLSGFWPSASSGITKPTLVSFCSKDEPIQTEIPPLIRSFILPPASFVRHRSALLQKGHAGWGGSVSSDPGYSLRGSPGTSLK